jgi:hypothetical protein
MRKLPCKVKFDANPAQFANWIGHYPRDVAADTATVTAQLSYNPSRQRCR